MWWTVWSNKPQNDCLLRREAAEETGRSSAVRQNCFLVCWVFLEQSWLFVTLMLISHPLGFHPPIIFCARREVQFLPLGQNTCSAQQQLVGTWILLQVSLSCLTLVTPVPTTVPCWGPGGTLTRVIKLILKAVVVRCKASLLTTA